MQKSTLSFSIRPLLIVCFCLFFNSCRTDRCDTPDCETINKIDPEFARFWDFGYGSYWVYNLKSDTTVLDTLSLEADILKTNGSCPPFDYFGPSCTKFYGKRLFHRNKKYFNSIDTQFNGQFYIRVEGNIHWITLVSTSNSKYRGLEVVNFSFKPYPNTEMQLIDTFPIVFNKTSYDNVAHLQTTLDTSIRKFIYTNQWWSKDIGLIKFSTSDGLEWELKNYQIKK